MNVQAGREGTIEEGTTSAAHAPANGQPHRVSIQPVDGKCCRRFISTAAARGETYSRPLPAQPGHAHEHIMKEVCRLMKNKRRTRPNVQ